MPSFCSVWSSELVAAISAHDVRSGRRTFDSNLQLSMPFLLIFAMASIYFRDKP
jgi:hypothetical protein